MRFCQWNYNKCLGGGAGFLPYNLHLGDNTNPAGLTHQLRRVPSVFRLHDRYAVRHNLANPDKIRYV